jgi:hypothetical protein
LCVVSPLSLPTIFLLDFGLVVVFLFLFFILSAIMYGNMIYFFHKTPLSVPNSWFKKMKNISLRMTRFLRVSALFFNNKTPTKSKCGHFFFLRSSIKINLLALGKRKVVSFPRIPVIVAGRSEDPFRKHL